MSRVTRAWSRWRTALALCTALLAWPSAHAHLMMAQRGTLNVVNNGAFMVLALPVSAFDGLDTGGNGLLSPAELQAQVAHIQHQVLQGVQLWSDTGPLPLQGLLLQLSPDEHPASEARHLVVMGRFAVEGPTQDLQLHLSLFGTHPEEKTQSILVSQGERTHRLVLSASQPNGWLLPSAGRTVVNHAREGFTHVLNGPDHLLFLLVVLAAGGGWRRMVWTLTSFTIGHAVTLTASVLWDLKLPSSVVEPAIAATILGMAAFDRWLVNHRGRVWSPSLRLGLVFGCALVHGLGLAGALADLELNTEQRLLSLLGFNLGIELAQLAVALAAAVAMNTAVRWWGRAGPATLRQATTVTAWLAGSVWLVLRMTNGG